MGPLRSEAPIGSYLMLKVLTVSRTDLIRFIIMQRMKKERWWLALAIDLMMIFVWTCCCFCSA